MVVRAFKSAVMKFEATLTGHMECRGVFRVVDAEGQPLSGVKVSYRVGGSDWIPCGASGPFFSRNVNFSQLSSVFYPIGESVAWRFSKPGFAGVKITRYTADLSFDNQLGTVVMSPAKESVSSAKGAVVAA